MPPVETPAPAPRAGAVLAPAVLVLAVLAMFAPALGPGQFLYRDTGRMHHPEKQLFAGSLRSGRLPQWDPWSGLGAPLVADPVHAVQHPFGVFLVTMPYEAAFKAWVIASVLAAALGACAWARALGAGRAGAVGAGLAFGLSGFVVSSTDNLTYLTAGAFVPLLLATGLRFCRRGGIAALAAVALCAYACAAAGDPVTFGIALLALPAQALALAAPGERRRSAVRGLGATAVGALAAAPVLVPLLLWLPRSTRAEPLAESGRLLWNLPPWRVLEVGLPLLTRDASNAVSSEVLRVFAGYPASFGPWVLSLYVGVVALAAATVAPRRVAAVLLPVAALFSWMAMGHYAGFGDLASHLPVLRSLRFWEKLMLWPSLALSALGGLGLSRALGDRLALRRFAWTGATGTVGLLLLTSLARTPLLADLLAASPAGRAAAELAAANVAEGSARAAVPLALAAVLAGLGLRRGLPRLLPAALVALVFVDAVLGNAGAYRLSDPPSRSPPSPMRQFLGRAPGLTAVVTPFQLESGPFPGLAPWESRWLMGAQSLHPMWNVSDRVRNAWAYAALQPWRIARLEARTPPAAQVATLGLFDVAHAVVPGGPEGLAGTSLAPPWVVSVRDPVLDVSLVRIPHRPRAYLAAEVRSVSEEEAFAFASRPASVPGTASVVEATLPPGFQATAGAAALLSDLPERVELKTEAAGTGLLVLNDAWAEGWSAEVDGQAAPIVPANAAVRGVFLPPGGHRVVFRYVTPGLWWGWALAGLLALALGAAGLWRRLRRGAASQGVGPSGVR